MPLRIAGTDRPERDDRERRLGADPSLSPDDGHVHLPDRLGRESVSSRQRHRRTAPPGSAMPLGDIYLVTRLDGFTVEDALGLIDRAAAPARTDGSCWISAPASDDVPEQLARRGGEGAARRPALAIASRSRPPAACSITRRAGPRLLLLGLERSGADLRRLDLQFVPGAIAGDVPEQRCADVHRAAGRRGNREN